MLNLNKDIKRKDNCKIKKNHIHAPGRLPKLTFSTTANTQKMKTQNSRLVPVPCSRSQLTDILRKMLGE